MSFNDEFLYRISLKFDYMWESKKAPIYVVARNTKSAKEYAEKHIKEGCSIKTISCLGLRLGINMYSGANKEKKT